MGGLGGWLRAGGSYFSTDVISGGVMVGPHDGSSGVMWRGRDGQMPVASAGTVSAASGTTQVTRR